MNEPDRWSRPDPHPWSIGPAKGVNGSFFNATAKEQSRDILVDNATDRLVVRDSVEKGRGIFATKEIKKSEGIFLSCGELRTTQSKTRECLWGNPMSILVNAKAEPGRGILKYEYLDPYTDNPLRYLNHSCEPNMGRFGSYMFVAMRDIQAGEELTADYATLEAHPDWRMSCQCGTSACRKVIGAIQTLPPELIEQYRAYIPPFLLRIYEDAQTSGVNHTRRSVNGQIQPL